jgi:hypothetical protein
MESFFFWYVGRSIGNYIISTKEPNTVLSTHTLIMDRTSTVTSALVMVEPINADASFSFNDVSLYLCTSVGSGDNACSCDSQWLMQRPPTPTTGGSAINFS